MEQETTCGNCGNGNGAGGCAYPIPCFDFSEWRPETPYWRPIKSPPEEGVHVLLFRPHIQFVGYLSYDKRRYVHNAPGIPFVDPPPTHWTPLPPSPAC